MFNDLQVMLEKKVKLEEQLEAQVTEIKRVVFDQCPQFVTVDWRRLHQAYSVTQLEPKSKRNRAFDA